MKIEIIYEDKDVIVIYKPAGLATQTARVDREDVVSGLKRYLQNKGAYVGVVHRLDQPVEGLLVFAKTKQAAANLTAQLQNKDTGESLNKRYYAVAGGGPIAEQGTLENYLYKDKENKAIIVDENIATAKKASLSYRLVSQTKTSQTSHKTAEASLYFFEIQLHTGRFHQIRAQMAHAGVPLLGDQKYGSTASIELSKALGVRDVALCAYALEFKHPKTGEGLAFEITPKGKVFGLFSEKPSY